MNYTEKNAVSILLVDDEVEFRAATGLVLSRRGFDVDRAGSGEEAVKKVTACKPDLVLLDLKMPGMGGIDTLREIRKIEPRLPVIILTGHGDLDSALQGIELEIVDFINKPIDIDLLAERIEELLAVDHDQRGLRERRIEELMADTKQYRRVCVEEPVENAVQALLETNSEEVGRTRPGNRSILVFDRDDYFVGMIRFQNLLRLVVPDFEVDSPYPAYFTGMFVAQCKLISKRSIRDLIEDEAVVDVSAPLIEAVHLMVTHHLINLPVLSKGRLVGVLRERDIVAEIADYVLGP